MFVSSGNDCLLVFKLDFFESVFLMKWSLAFLITLSFVFAAVSVDAKELITKKYVEDSLKWEKDIQALEKLNQTETHPKNSILFIGSSSIRLWKTIDEDLKPYHPIRRGFGGAKISDVAIYLPRLIGENSFQALVFFVGGNDLWGAKDDKTPKEILDLGNALVKKVRQENPQAPIFFIEITPSPRREYLAKKEINLNNALRTVCSQNKNVHFIETMNSFLTEDKKRTAKWFSDDELHMNHQGYKLWAKLIRAQLDAVLKSNHEEKIN